MRRSEIIGQFLASYSDLERAENIYRSALVEGRTQDAGADSQGLFLPLSAQDSDSHPEAAARARRTLSPVQLPGENSFFTKATGAKVRKIQ